MDFAKTLLIYMSLVLAAGVQAAPTLEVTPVPSPTPVVIAADGKTYARQGTEAGETPAPTITPNAGYHILQSGDKGNEVRRLQERLRDLGYLSGNVDGVYGAQTRNAVLLFQTYHGLTRDGVAGKVTQTILYEDPYVMPNPEKITPSPEPTQTPDEHGLIPVAGKSVHDWQKSKDTRVLYNGAILPENPGIYLSGADIYIDLQQLSQAAGWAFVSSNAQSMMLSAMDNQLMASMNVFLRNSRSTEDTSYCEAYDLSVNGSMVPIAQGALVYESEKWYVSLPFMEASLHATVYMDAGENTLVLTVPQRSLAESDD